MSSRAAKRARYSDIKNMLVNDLHKLTIDSGDLNNDLVAAHNDFVLMFKSMEDRLSQQLTHSLMLMEKYREVNDVLKKGAHSRIGEPANVPLPPSYSENIRKFIEDSSTSLAGHTNMLREQLPDMLTVFEEFGKTWNTKLGELKGNVTEISEEKEKLVSELTDYTRNL